MLDLFLSLSALVVFVFGLYKAYGWWGKSQESKQNGVIESKNIIRIIHKTDEAIVSTVMSAEKQTITMSTMISFMKTYDKLDHSRDIYIVLHTPGGVLSAGEAIVNIILNHRQKKGVGQIIAVIPYYAYSCGAFIALACDRIIMTANSVVGPCVAQLPTEMKNFSVASIIDTVETKIRNGEKIKEDWLATAFNAKQALVRQRESVERFVSEGLFSADVMARIYNELFSGKYNHDLSIPARALQDLGAPVTIVDRIDPDIMDLFTDNY